MDLLTYLRVIRRRWAMILAAVVVGAALGAGSALAGSSSGGASGRAYKATHVFLLDSSEDSSEDTSALTDLDRMAVLTTSGDVPRRVGTELGQDGRQLAEQVLITVNEATNTLEISAASRDAGESEKIADSFAKQLVGSLSEREQQRFDASRKQVLERLDQVRAQINDFDAQLADPGLANRDLVQAQRDALVDVYRLTYEQFQQLANDGPSTLPLVTLEDAQAVPIDTAEYGERLSRGQFGENIIHVGDTPEDSGAIVTSGSVTFEGPVSRGFLGAFLGLLGGVGLALVVDRLDQRVRSRHDIEAAFGLPVIAEVPRLTRAQQRDADVVSFAAPLSRTAEAHRTLRSSLLFQLSARSGAGANGDGEGREPLGREAHRAEPGGQAAVEPIVLLITSPLPNEGKTTTSANLAAVFAESGASVLAINCDFRRPSLHRYLGAENEPRRILDTTIPGVKLVAGVLADETTNPAQVLAAQCQVIAMARQRFDVVLVDTAPFLTTNDAIEVIPWVDLVVLVSRPAVTTVDGAQRARELLDRVKAPVAGVVLVGDEGVPNDPYYYYNNYASVPAGPARSQRGDSVEWHSAGDDATGEEPTVEIDAVSADDALADGHKVADSEFFEEEPTRVVGSGAKKQSTRSA